MAIDQLNVKLNLDEKEFADGLKSAISLIKKLDSAIEDTDEKIRRNSSVIKAWAKSVRGSLTEFYSLTQLISPLTNAATAMTTSFIRANAEFEKTTAVLSGLTTGAENTEQATAQLNNEIARLEELATSTPFTMQALQNSMVKLKAGGVDNLDFAMQALIDSVAAFGGTATELDRASIAIQQMAGKGVVSMEELRQQLGEAVPNAMKLMAQGLNVSMGELANLVESGTLEATSALQAMFVQMALVNEGSAEEMTKTWDGTMSQISARLNKIMREMGEAGLFDELKAQAQAFLDFINQPETLDFFVELSKDITNIIQKTIEFIKYVDDLNVVMDILRNLIAAMALKTLFSSLSSIVSVVDKAAVGFGKMVTAVQNVYTPLKNMRVELEKQKRVLQISQAMFGEYNQQLVKNGNRIKRNQIVTDGLRASMSAMSKLAGTVGRSLLSMAGPIGAAVAVVIELAQAFNLFGDEVDSIREKAGDRTIAITAEEYTTLAKNVSDSKDKIADLNKDLEKQQAILKESPVGTRVGTQAALRASSLQAQIADLQKEMTEGEAALATQNKLIAKRAADEFGQAFDSAFDVVGRQLKIDYNKALEEIENVRKDPGALAGKALTEELNQMKEEADKTFIERRTAAAKAAAEELYIARKTEVEKANIDETARKNQLEGLNIAYQEQLSEITAWENKLTEQTSKIREDGITQLDKSGNFWTEAYKKSFVELSGWMAKLSGENVNYAKSVAKVQLAAKKDAQYTREQAEAIAKRVENVKANIAADKQLASERDKLSKAEAKIAASQAQVEETNPWLKISSSQKTYMTSIEMAKQLTDEMTQSFGENSSKAKEAASIMAGYQQLLAQQQGIDLTKMVKSIEDQTTSLQKQVMTETQLRQVRKADYEEQRGYINDLIKDVDLISAKTGISKDVLVKTFEDYGTALDQNFVASNRNAVDSLLVSWQDTTAAMDDMWANTMSGLSSALSNFVMTGKLDFESLTNSILKNILEISIQAATSQVFGGVIGNLFGSGTAAAAANTGTTSIQGFAKGGIAKANSPQVAVFGEGSQNEAFVPLPDGRAIPVDMNGSQSAPNVSVNVINQTGTDATAEQQGQPRFDGEKYILDVVMKAMNRPGQFRSSMKGSNRQR